MSLALRQEMLWKVSFEPSLKVLIKKSVVGLTKANFLNIRKPVSITFRINFVLDLIGSSSSHEFHISLKHASVYFVNLMYTEAIVQ